MSSNRVNIHIYYSTFDLYFLQDFLPDSAANKLIVTDNETATQIQ